MPPPTDEYGEQIAQTSKSPQFANLSVVGRDDHTTTTENHKIITQDTSCNDFECNAKELPICIDCAIGNDVDYCRHVNFRRIALKSDGKSYLHRGFTTASTGEPPLPTTVRMPWSEEQALYVLRYTSPVIEQAILYERRLLNLWSKLHGGFINGKALTPDDWCPELWPVRRPVDDGQEPMRELCDICETALFNLFLLCKSCCVQICAMCAVERGSCPNTKIVPTKPSLSDAKKSALHKKGMIGVGKCDSYGWRKCTQRTFANDVNVAQFREHSIDVSSIATMTLASNLPLDPKERKTPIAQLVKCNETARNMLKSYCQSEAPPADWMKREIDAGHSLDDQKNLLMSPTKLQRLNPNPQRRPKSITPHIEDDVSHSDITNSDDGSAPPLAKMSRRSSSASNNSNYRLRSIAPLTVPLGHSQKIVPGEHGVLWMHKGRTMVMKYEWTRTHPHQALPMFQTQWQKSQPIIVSGIECDPNLWSAAQLANDYNPLHGGTIRDCATKSVYKGVDVDRTELSGMGDFCRKMFGKAIHGQLSVQPSLVEVDTVIVKMEPVEEESTLLTPSPSTDGEGVGNMPGFVNAELERNVTRLYHCKISDYPTSTTFQEALPAQYKDACAALPFQQYTTPSNSYADPSAINPYNLASLLPPHILSPDLGPKMYMANGMLLAEQFVTTPLHLDISCAVNILTNVQQPGGLNEAQFVEKLKTHLINENITGDEFDRVMRNPKEAGAIWVIWPAEMADKIRHFVERWVPDNIRRLKQLVECGQLDQEVLDTLYDVEIQDDGREIHIPKDDAIHDQTCFLNGTVRRIMKSEMGIDCNEFVQMKCDAVFIPSGAPHQVQNVSDCIKAALDFVSAEGAQHALQNTRELRRLPDSHVNHADKLQLFNIMYYAQKHAIQELNKIVHENK